MLTTLARVEYLFRIHFEMNRIATSGGFYTCITRGANVVDMQTTLDRVVFVLRIHSNNKCEARVIRVNSQHKHPEI